MTDRARRAVVLAQEEALNTDCAYISNPHLLIGVLLAGGVGTEVLQEAGVVEGSLRTKIETAFDLPKSSRAPGDRKVPFTDATKKALELSLREALQLGHNYIGTEHMLLGLLRSTEPIAEPLGLDPSALKRSVIGKLAQYDARRDEQSRNEEQLEEQRIALESSARPPIELDPSELLISERVAGFQPDDPLGTDHLDINGDVQVLALLLGSRTVKPPLSLGLFGDWGAGKSYFMKAMQRRIALLASSEHEGYCGRVRQITFNAWHYTDADLWASLVSHIFDELGKDKESWAILEAELAGESGEGTRLADEIAARQDAITELEARRDELRSAPGVLAEPSQELSDLSSHFGVPAPSLTSSWRALRYVLARPLLLIRRVKALSTRTKTTLVALLVATAVFFAIGGLAQVAGFIVAAAALITSGRELGEQVRAEVARATDLIGRAEEAHRHDEEAVEAQLDVQRAEIRDLKDARDALGVSGRWRQMLATRGEASYRTRLGVINEIRRDLEHLADLMGAQDSDAPVDRIVLYVDDLDRCNARRVVEVLEAVHLLLAIPLFVVVVAVDRRWLESALSEQYGSLLGNSSTGNGASPQDYLEKIFQLAYSVPGMSSDQFGGFVRDLLEPGTEIGVATDSGSNAVVASAATDRLASSERNVPGPSPDPDQGLAALRLSEPEIAFLSLLGELVVTPRNGKRILNTYRLIRARHQGERLRVFVEGLEYRAVGILLALVTRGDASARELVRSIESAREGSIRAAIARVPESNRLKASLVSVLDAADRAGLGAPIEASTFRRLLVDVRRFTFSAGA